MAEQPRQRRSRVALAALLGGMAVLHVAVPRPFEAMVPRWLPGDAGRWNLAAGAAEALSAALLARPATARLGGCVAFATILGVYPANVEAVRQGGYRGAPAPLDSRAAAVARLPLQGPLLWWAASVARGARD